MSFSASIDPAIARAIADGTMDPREDGLYLWRPKAYSSVTSGYPPDTFSAGAEASATASTRGYGSTRGYVSPHSDMRGSAQQTGDASSYSSNVRAMSQMKTGLE